MALWNATPKNVRYLKKKLHTASLVQINREKLTGPYILNTYLTNGSTLVLYYSGCLCTTVLW